MKSVSKMLLLVSAACAACARAPEQPQVSIKDNPPSFVRPTESVAAWRVSVQPTVATAKPPGKPSSAPPRRRRSDTRPVKKPRRGLSRPVAPVVTPKAAVAPKPIVEPLPVVAPAPASKVVAPAPAPATKNVTAPVAPKLAPEEVKGPACQHDDTYCKKRLAELLADSSRAWIKSAPVPLELVSSVRLFAFNSERNVLTCEELKTAVSEGKLTVEVLVSAVQNPDVTQETKLKLQQSLDSAISIQAKLAEVRASRCSSQGPP